MTQDCGACGEMPVENGMKVKADKDFGAIEVSLVVKGTSIGFFMTTEEAQQLVEALQDAVVKMNSDCCSGACEAERTAETPTEATDESKAEENA